jgi:outer membrane protein assembly factor BamB
MSDFKHALRALVGAPALIGSAAAVLSLWSSSPAAHVPQDPVIVGTWEGFAVHAGERSRLVLRIEQRGSGEQQALWSTAALDVWDEALGRVTVTGTTVQAGPLTLTYDRTRDTLSTTLPPAIVPVYTMRVVFHRSDHVSRPLPAVSDARHATPVWSFDAGAPIWGDMAADRTTLFIGDDAGSLHALDADTGAERWTFRAGGAIRAKPGCEGGALLVQADDGFLYKVDAVSGRMTWKTQVNKNPIRRLPLGDPHSRYDWRASAAAVAAGSAYLGTDDGHVLALDVATGQVKWSFAAADAVVGSPVVRENRVYAGSFDGRVYALDAATGAPVWSRDTHGAVASAPEVHSGLVIVGNRSYDLIALRASDGGVVWTRYVWFSWVESPGHVFGDVLHIGSSDAAKLFALDPNTGSRRWEARVAGSAWGEPAVTATRVYEGTAGMLNYVPPHRADLIALDRQNGRPVWRFEIPPPAASGRKDVVPFGFSGSPAVANGRVYIGSIEGSVYAFAQ